MGTEQVDLAESKKKKRKECFNRGSVDTFVREVRGCIILVVISESTVLDRPSVH